MSSGDLTAVLLTLKLATVTTLLLMLIGPFLAWYLARSYNRFAVLIESLVAVPLILPPTVLGFYLLLLFSPNSWPGAWLAELFGKPLVFSFSGLVFASMLYSLPFVVQPLQAAFRSLDPRILENARLMRLGPYERVFKLIIPLTRQSFVVATLLAFAHTVGEFGVVLMIGGNIPGETRVLSIALFDQVESMNYDAAHQLALILLGFSMATLFLVYGYFGRKASLLRWG